MTTQYKARPLTLIMLLVSVSGCFSYLSAGETTDDPYPGDTTGSTGADSDTSSSGTSSLSGASTSSGTGTTTGTTTGTSTATTAVTSTTFDSSSSGDPCGNGILDEDEDEECDDGNSDSEDGCSQTCTWEFRTVFVTSELYTGDIKGDSPLEVADHHCNTLANEALKEGTYMAWLSTKSESAGQRLGLMDFEGKFIGTNDGNVIAYGWTLLTNDPLVRPIKYDENGMYTSGTVWTNTDQKGEMASTNDCNGWTSIWKIWPFVSHLGTVGYPSRSDPAWTSAGQRKCSETAHLYCFQVSP